MLYACILYFDIIYFSYSISKKKVVVLNSMDYFDNYLSYLRFVKLSSENTIESYMRDLKQAYNYFNTPLHTLSPQQLQNYIDSQKESNRSPATISRNIMALKSFYSWLLANNIIGINPAESLMNEKPKPKVPEVLSESEVELLLAQPNRIDLKGYRDKAMLEILYSSGLRVSELIDLRIGDIDVGNSQIVLVRKENNRQIPLPYTTVKALNEYICFIRKQIARDAHEDHLFFNLNGSPLTRQGFWKILKEYQKKAGIEKNITPHTLRHSIAAHMLKNGTDVHVVQRIMGHSDISTTNMYSQIYNAD